MICLSWHVKAKSYFSWIVKLGQKSAIFSVKMDLPCKRICKKDFFWCSQIAWVKYETDFIEYNKQSLWGPLRPLKTEADSTISRRIYRYIGAVGLLRQLRLLYKAFSIHLKHQKAQKLSLDEAISKLETLDNFFSKGSGWKYDAHLSRNHANPQVSWELCPVKRSLLFAWYLRDWELSSSC